MKFITISTGVPERFHVATLMNDMIDSCSIEWHIVVHDDLQAKRLRDGNVRGIDKAHIHVSYQTPQHRWDGAAVQREWAERNLTDIGEWYVTVDDNVREVRGLPRDRWPTAGAIPQDQTNALRKSFVTKLSAPEAYRRTIDLIHMCETVGTDVGAFATGGGNPRFLTRHWRKVAPCNTRWSVQRNQGRTWLPWPNIMLEDLVRAVMVVAETGAAVVDNWSSTHKQDGEPGGLGPSYERRPAQRSDCQRLMAMYPGLLKHPKGTDWFLAFAKNKPESVRRWIADQANQLVG